MRRLRETDMVVVQCVLRYRCRTQLMYMCVCGDGQYVYV